VRASIAESSIETNLGLGVIIALELVEAASKCFATRRRVTSVSVNIPTNPPPGPVSSAASPLFLHSICTIDNTLSFGNAINGFLGRSFETFLSLFVGDFSIGIDIASFLFCIVSFAAVPFAASFTPIIRGLSVGATGSSLFFSALTIIGISFFTVSFFWFACRVRFSLSLGVTGASDLDGGSNSIFLAFSFCSFSATSSILVCIFSALSKSFWDSANSICIFRSFSLACHSFGNRSTFLSSIRPLTIF